jgi:hypothetical protein
VEKLPGASGDLYQLHKPGLLNKLMLAVLSRGSRRVIFTLVSLL